MEENEVNETLTPLDPLMFEIPLGDPDHQMVVVEMGEPTDVLPFCYLHSVRNLPGGCLSIMQTRAKAPNGDVSVSVSQTFIPQVRAFVDKEGFVRFCGASNPADIADPKEFPDSETEDKPKRGRPRKNSSTK